MGREKAYFRETVEILTEQTGKTMFTATDIQKYLRIRYEKAARYLPKGKKQITVFEFARQLL